MELTVKLDGAVGHRVWNNDAERLCSAFSSKATKGLGSSSTYDLAGSVKETFHLNMATPYKIVLGPEDVGSFHKGPYGPIVAAKVSEVLQCNLESWDILFAGHRHSKRPIVANVEQR